MKDAPGMVSVVSDELARYSAFAWSMLNLQRPEGSQIRWFMGADICRNLNNGIRDMLENHPELEWYWSVGDDHAFDPDLLERLLEHEVDCVAPLCCRRRNPFYPVVFDSENEDGTVNTLDLNAAGYTPESGLVEVYAVGGAGLLLSRELLEALRDPWWEHSGVAMLDEDLHLCRKIRDLGVPIHVDMGAHLGHLSTMGVWPRFDGKRWSPGIRPNSGALRFDERGDPRGGLVNVG